MQTMDNVLGKPQSAFANSGEEHLDAKFLSTVNSLASSIQNGSTENFTYTGENIALLVAKVEKTNFPLVVGAKSTVCSSCNESAGIQLFANTSISHFTLGEAYVSIPKTILDFISGELLGNIDKVCRLNIEF